MFLAALFINATLKKIGPILLPSLISWPPGRTFRPASSTAGKKIFLFPFPVRFRIQRCQPGSCGARLEFLALLAPNCSKFMYCLAPFELPRLEFVCTAWQILPKTSEIWHLWRSGTWQHCPQYRQFRDLAGAGTSVQGIAVTKTTSPTSASSRQAGWPAPWAAKTASPRLSRGKPAGRPPSTWRQSMSGEAANFILLVPARGKGM